MKILITILFLLNNCYANLLLPHAKIPTTVAASNLDAQKINLKATSKEADKGNILIQGVNGGVEIGAKVKSVALF